MWTSINDNNWNLESNSISNWLIEASSEEEAKIIFKEKFNRDLDEIANHYWKANKNDVKHYDKRYFIESNETLKDLTGLYRQCRYIYKTKINENNGKIDYYDFHSIDDDEPIPEGFLCKPSPFKCVVKSISLEDYLKDETILVLKKEDLNKE